MKKNIKSKKGLKEEFQELMKENKPFLIAYGSILLLVLFFTLIHQNQISFFFVSLGINLFLINVVKETIKCLNIKFTKKQIIIMICSILFIYLFYGISIATRKFIYYWDYSCYYKIQIETINAFNRGLFDGIKSLIGSTWGGEYGNFLSFISQIGFAFTNKTANSYLMSSIVVFAPYMVVGISILLKKVIETWKVQKQEESIYLISMCSFCLFPLVYAASIYGQPDLFGLFFLFLIMSLTIGYRFEKIDLKRLVLIFFTTYMLFITRRWYVYWILAYYLCYGIPILIDAIKMKEKGKEVLINIFSFAGICGFLFLITLFPLIKNIVANDYGSHYVFYSSGGFFTEIMYQIKHLGLATLIIILMGTVFCLIRKEYRSLIISTWIEILLIIFFFTRIQLMGFHHTLLLVTEYFLFIVGFIAFFSEGKRKKIIYTSLVILFGLNFTFSIVGIDNILYTDASLKVPNEENYQEIGEVVEYLKEILNPQETAYMISHTGKFNPDKLRCYDLPDETIANYLPYGSAVIGVHPFPTELFTAKYIITTFPFESISMEEKYQQVFDQIKDDKFELIKTFDMKNGYIILIYKREKEVDEEEINLYIEALEEESKQFKNLYEDKLIEYKKSLK